jgi:hypothetical protein
MAKDIDNLIEYLEQVKKQRKQQIVQRRVAPTPQQQGLFSKVNRAYTLVKEIAADKYDQPQVQRRPQQKWTPVQMKSYWKRIV